MSGFIQPGQECPLEMHLLVVSPYCALIAISKHPHWVSSRRCAPAAHLCAPATAGWNIQCTALKCVWCDRQVFGTSLPRDPLFLICTCQHRQKPVIPCPLAPVASSSLLILPHKWNPTFSRCRRNRLLATTQSK